MRPLKICILGGTGFVGRNITLKLIAQGHEVLLFTRHRERNRSLLVLPSLNLIEADIHDIAVLRKGLRGMDVVINLVAILNQGRRKTAKFQYVHVELTKKLVEAMNQAGVRRLLHMSALNADTDSPSLYLRSKGAAEDVAHEYERHGVYAVTSFRPSVIFGKGDGFTMRFANLLRKIPVTFPLACPNTRMQPIHVQDVAQCCVNAIPAKQTYGKRYDLCGPQAYALREIVEYLAATMRLNRRILNLSNWQSRLQAGMMEFAPGKPFTVDNYKMLQIDSVCNCPMANELDVTPVPMEQIVPTYLR